MINRLHEPRSSDRVWPYFNSKTTHDATWIFFWTTQRDVEGFTIDGEKSNHLSSADDIVIIAHDLAATKTMVQELKTEYVELRERFNLLR